MENIIHDLTKEIHFKPSEIQSDKIFYFEAAGNILSDHEIDYRKYEFEKKWNFSEITMEIKDVSLSMPLSECGKPITKQIGPDTFFTTVSYKIMKDSVAASVCTDRTIPVVMQIDYKYGDYKFYISVKDKNIKKISMKFVGIAILKKENIIL